MFDRLVDLTEPICQRIDKEKASMLLFDTSGIEAWVTENNPKYANRIIKQLKSFKKANGLDDSFDPYKAAYGSMPPLILRFSRCISMGISVMLINSAPSQTGWVLSGIFPFITKSFSNPIPKLLWKKNRIPQTKTRALPIPRRSSPP